MLYKLLVLKICSMLVELFFWSRCLPPLVFCLVGPQDVSFGSLFWFLGKLFISLRYPNCDFIWKLKLKIMLGNRYEVLHSKNNVNLEDYYVNDAICLSLYWKIEITQKLRYLILYIGGHQSAARGSHMTCTPLKKGSWGPLPLVVELF